MAGHVFPGFPPYLARALALLDTDPDPGRRFGPEIRNEAIRLHSLTRLANLLAQVGDAAPKDRPGLLREALKSRDALAVAHCAAELMVEDLHEGHGLVPPRQQARPAYACGWDYGPPPAGDPPETPTEPDAPAPAGRRRTRG